MKNQLPESPPKRRPGRPAWAPLGEQTQPIRVPKSLVPLFSEYLERRKQLSATKPIGLGGNVAELLSLSADAPSLALPFVTSPCPQAGFPSPAADHVEDVLDLNQLMVKNPTATYFLRVRGASMEDARIFDGDILVVDRSLEAKLGRVVVAAYDGNFYVKRLKSIRGRQALISENAARAAEFPPMYLDQAQDVTMWGTVTGTTRNVV